MGACFPRTVAEPSSMKAVSLWSGAAVRSFVALPENIVRANAQARARACGEKTE